MGCTGARSLQETLSFLRACGGALQWVWELGFRFWVRVASEHEYTAVSEWYFSLE